MFVTQPERRIAVIGLGYVGLSLALAAAEGNSGTIGFDADEQRIKELKRRTDRNNDVKVADLRNSSITFTCNEKHLRTANVFIVCVPTPVNNISKVPDFGALKSASQIIGGKMRKGSIVIFESTVYPTATREICEPELLKAAKRNHKDFSREDFWLGYSPERVSPGDAKLKLESTAKIVSGESPRATRAVKAIYASFLKRKNLKSAKSIEVAEAAKLLENVYRDVNIALMNEFALICRRIGVDMTDVLKAAKSKPGFNRDRFKPGLVGGHCISVDPYYLVALARKTGRRALLISAARQVNNSMSREIVLRVTSTLRKEKIKPPKAHIGILGATFKEGVKDTRDSRVFDIVEGLSKKHIKVSIHDPIADEVRLKKAFRALSRVHVVPKVSQLKKCDVVVLAVTHREYVKEPMRWLKYLRDGTTVIDVKSTLKQKDFPDRLVRAPL